MKILGDDKSIRSSLTVKEVVGELSGDHLSKIIQEKCGAEHLRVDASSKRLWGYIDTMEGDHSLIHGLIAGSFAISEDTKPRVINLDFPPLPTGSERSQKLIENGAEKSTDLLCIVEAKIYQMPSSPPSLISFHQTSLLSCTLLHLPMLLINQPLLSRSPTRWMLNSKCPCIWTSNETFRIISVHLMATLLYQMDLCSNDINISAQVVPLHPWEVSTCGTAH